ncbi:cysteine hydrolase family protein [Actinokineospora auranticolor]|uniref:Nicotinamidase-related amidase n=1 Tax=Actinokineospora auranticolor TaxID=155976 RepID=A0A2S6GGB7_9PSEU|nr:cysteine hydrolase family protein [Actinokineospora auranticolor]PPK64250.1 nicotinamidase-related amidase [Actinokineospora auranticolor]
MTTALILIDVQQGFDDPVFGPRNNPAAETNIKTLLDAWAAAGQPLVLVRHDSLVEGSPLHPGTPGSRFKPVLDDAHPDLLFTKTVHSSFHGSVDLHGWLTTRGIERIVLAGIQTNFCVETTARVGGNLGFDVHVALDATYTFNLGDLTADELSKATATNLQGGGFATVSTTAEVLTLLD